MTLEWTTCPDCGTEHTCDDCPECWWEEWELDQLAEDMEDA